MGVVGVTEEAVVCAVCGVRPADVGDSAESVLRVVGIVTRMPLPFALALALPLAGDGCAGCAGCEERSSQEVRKLEMMTG